MNPRYEIAAPEGVRLWGARLNVAAEIRKSLAATLSPTEHDRAAKFLHPRDAERYEVARGTLRFVLAELIGGTDPAELELGVEPGSDKPTLASHPGIVFNVSHCGDRLLIATANGEVGALGVDLEETRILPDTERQSIADRFFSPGERDELQRHKDPTKKAAAFFTCWTRKEAVVKGLGTGLDTPLGQFHVGMQAPAFRNEAMPVIAEGALREQLLGWTVHAVDLGPDWPAALAVRRRP
jgi:4'-phosphopantetheinyl transferase